MRKVIEEAVNLLEELDNNGCELHILNGDTDRIAVTSGGGITVFESYDNETVNQVWLPEECFSKLIKLMQEG